MDIDELLAEFDLDSKPAAKPRNFSFKPRNNVKNTQKLLLDILDEDDTQWIIFLKINQKISKKS